VAKLQRWILSAWVLALLVGGLIRPLPLSSQATPDQLLFGPKQYVRATGQPVTVTDSFAVPPSIGPPFLFHLVNGDATGAHLVTAATVVLNGVQIVRNTDFTPNVTVIDRTVTLQATNTLQVTINEPRGGTFTISLLGTKILPTPTTLTPNPLTITVGATGTLTATLSPTPTAAGTLSVTSSNTGVATVPASVSFASGQSSVPVPVSAVSAGNAMITVSANGGTATSTVQVNPQPPTVTSLTPGTLTITQGGSGVLTVTISAAQLTTTTVSLNSTASGIAFVPSTVTVPAGQTSASISVNANTPGTAQITTSLNGTSASSTVTVTPAQPTVVSLLPPANPVTLGATTTLTVTISAAQPNATLLTVSATPSGIVTVPSTVTVPANQTSAPAPVGTLALGTAMVTTSLNGTTTAAAVQVLPPAPALVSLLPSPINVVVNATGTLTVTLNAAQQTNTVASLSVDHSNVLHIPASVTIPSGQTHASFTVTGVAVGNAAVTATLTATTTTTQTAVVHVVPPPPTVVSLVPNPLAIQQGATGTFTLTINAAQPTDTSIPLTNSAPSVLQAPGSATVPAGQTSVTFPVTGLILGSATVTAAINSTSVSATVSVASPPTVVTALTPGTLMTPKGAPGVLHVTVSPAPTEPLSVSLTSNNSTVATAPATVPIPAGALGADFPVLSVGEGTATITASLNGGSASATVLVTPAELVTLTLSPQTATLFVGQTEPFTATGRFTDGTTQDLTTSVTWTSSNQSVATINASGVASALAAGTTTIAAASGSISADTTLTVLTPPALSLAPATATLRVGDSLTFTVTSAAPADVGGLTVTLTQSGAGSVTVPATVVIPEGQSSVTFTATGASAGDVTLTASAPIRLSASSTLTVTNLVPVLSSLSPNAAPSGSPALTLTAIGDRFAPGATMQFGTLTLAATVTSPTQLSVVVPPSALSVRGLVSVAVVNPSPGGGASNSLVFTIQNGPPALTPIGNQTVALGATLAFAVTATDPDNDFVTFAVTPLPLPPHASFHSETGQFVFTPDATQVGAVTLTFVASDGAASSSQTITINVTGAPPGGVTSLTGRVDDTTRNPVANVTVSLKGTSLSTVTDAQGQFTLTGIPSTNVGRQQVVVTGFAHGYANLVAPVDLFVEVTNQLPQPLTLPPVDMTTAVTVNPNATTVVQSATLNVSVTIPPHTAKNADGTDYTGVLTISPVPEYGRVEARPAELRPGLSITIQPAGVVLDPPVPITFPNVDNMAPGNELDLWSLSPDTGTFSLVGTMRVSADGQRIETVTGGVRKTAWHFPLAANPVPSDPQSAQQIGRCTTCNTGSGADLQEGALTLDHAVPGVRTLGVARDLTLHYRSTSADVRPIVPIDTFLSKLAAVPQTFSVRLTVGGIQQGPEVYWNASGLPETADSTSRLGVRFDAVSLTTGRYSYEAMLFSNYPQSSIGGGMQGQVLVRNEQASLFGAGWTLTGVDRLLPQPDGAVVVAESEGATKLFSSRLSLLAGLVSWWPGNGTVADIIGGNSGTLQGGATFATGEVGQALSFDGVDDFVQVPDNPNLDPGTGSFTIDAWVKTTKTTGDQMVVSKYECGQSCGGNSLYFFFVSNGRLAAWLRDSDALGPGLQQLSGTKFIADGQFHHIAMLRDMVARELRLYVDGNLDARAPLNAGGDGAITNDDGEPDPLLIGASFVGGTNIKTNFFAGTIDEVDYYNRALTAADIQAIFFAGSAGKPPTGTPSTVVTYTAPPGDYSTLVKNADGTFTRTLKDGTTRRFNAPGLLTAVTDRNGNTTTYGYDGSGRLTTITDPAGQVTTLSYSGSRLDSITDPAGRGTQVEHDSQGNLTAITYADGARESFVYDPQHRLTQRTDARGKVYQYAYDYAGRFTQATLPTGEVRTLTPTQRAAVPNVAAGEGTKTSPAPLAAPSPPASFQDGNGHTSTFTLDQLGQITKQTDALTRVTTIERDASGNPTTITRPNSAVTTMTYDAKGNLLTTTEQAISATTTFTYEPTFNQVTSIKDPRNNTTTITYDAKGNPLTITDADGKVTTLTYDSRGLLTSTKDALNQMTTFTYDSLGRLLTTTDPLTRTTTLTYDAAGNVATSTDALNRITTFEYDAKNRLKKVTDPATGVTEYTYDGNGNLLTVKDAKNQTTTFVYDARNRLASTTDPLGRTETYTYDGADNLLTRLTLKGDTITFAYDAVNQLLSKTLPGSEVTSYTYDAVGNLATVTDQDSALTMTYDLANRLTSVSTAGSSNQPAVTLLYTYDKTGNRLTLADPTGTNQYRYDALNRLLALTSPARTCSAPPSGLVSWWRGEGTAADSQDGNHGTLQGGATFAPGRVGQAFSLDGIDDAVSLANTPTMDVGAGDFTIEFWVQFRALAATQTLVNKIAGAANDQLYLVEFDAADASAGTPAALRFLIRDTTANQNDLLVPVSLNPGQWYHVAAVRTGNTSALYLDGQVLGSQTAGSNVQTGTGGSAALGKLSIVPARFVSGVLDEVKMYNRALGAGEIPALTCSDTTTYAYDALSRRTSVTLPNGTQTSYTYDVASQVQNVLHKITATSAQINKAEYVYNAVGNRTSLTDRRGVQNFGYDALDRLASATHPLLVTPQSFDYDAVGNRATNGSLYNGGNQLTEDANFTYTYDLNGNLTRKTFKASGNHTDYTYDAENRLTKVEEFAAGASTPFATATYRYDGLGRRTEKVGNGLTRRYVYDGEDILLEYDGTNVLQARYTHGPGIDEPIGMSRGGVNYFYHQDGLGTVTDLTDSTGATAQSYAYDAYGNIIQQTGSGENPYTYTGRELDAETGLYYFRARYYDPRSGRFLQKDPIGFRGGINFYAFVGDNPIRFKDPFGRSCGADKCREEADKAYNKCIANIDKLETYYTAGCVVGSVVVGVLTSLETGSVGLGASVGAIGVAGCLLIDWESIAFPAGKAGCGVLRQRIYDACKASQ